MEGQLRENKSPEVYNTLSEVAQILYYDGN